jgi:hypothetical protein
MKKLLFILFILLCCVATAAGPIINPYRFAGAPAGTGLLTNLTCFWKMDEASGNRLDLVSGQTLTPNGAPGTGTGLVYSTVADLEFSSSQYFSRASEATLQLSTDTSFTIAVWVKLESKDSFDNDIFTKDGAGVANNNSCEYGLIMDNAGYNRYAFTVGNNSANARVPANTFGSPGLAAWHMLVAWHAGGATDQIGISVNAGAADTAAWTGGTFAGSGPLNVGAVVGGARCFDGLIGPVMFWKNRVLSPADITLLYNGGAGLPYASW